MCWFRRGAPVRTRPRTRRRACHFHSLMLAALLSAALVKSPRAPRAHPHADSPWEQAGRDWASEAVDVLIARQRTCHVLRKEQRAHVAHRRCTGTALWQRDEHAKDDGGCCGEARSKRSQQQPAS